MKFGLLKYRDQRAATVFVGEPFDAFCKELKENE